MKYPYLLFVVAALFFVQFASAAGCVLKIYVRTPSDWTVVGPTVVGVNNTFINVSVRNIITNSEVTTASVNANIDLGQRSDLPYSTILVLPNTPVANGYNVSFREFNGSLHIINISAASAGCLPDYTLVHYQYRNNTIQGIPDFSPALVPAIAALSLFAMRANAGRKKRKAGNC